MMQARARLAYSAGLCAGALTVNMVFSMLNEALRLPFFLDSIGTAIAAAVSLPVGILVAVSTNLLQEVIFGFPGTAWPFALCGLATVAIVHAFVRADRFTTVGDAILVSLLVAAANAVLGGTIAAFVFGGTTGVGLDYLVTAIVATGQSLTSAAFWARLPANLFDKTLSVFAAYLLFGPLTELRRRILRVEE